MYNYTGIHKIINDPVHGFITINDPLILAIIDHPYFQRLRRIKQMALAHLVYPGAVHTRLHHCLGAYHLMRKALDGLKEKGVQINDEEYRGACIAILLHDIGHGPFSHALEHTIVDTHHEHLSYMVMQYLNTLHQGKLSTAIEIFQGTYPKKYLHQLVSSQLDTDRLDYLARDSFFTGVSEGVVGYERILKMLNVFNDNLIVEEKGIHSIEKFLIARRLMYWQVYLHKTVLSSETMLANILKRAKWLAQNELPLFATPSFDFFLKTQYNEESFAQNEACLQHFMQLDDHDIMACVKAWQQHSDPIISDLCSRLLNRKLFKVQFSNEPNNTLYQQLKSIIIQENNIKEADIAYYLYSAHTTNITYLQETDIEIQYRDGTIKPIQNIENTLISPDLLIPTKKYYICYLTNK